ADMLSLDEPLDLKLPSGRTDGRITLGKRTYPSAICRPICFPSPPSSPESQFSPQDGPCCSPPAVDLRLAPPPPPPPPTAVPGLTSSL
ncbi:sulfated surface glycoprotein 185-like, partial [Gymnodraco acuticeps]|uniref:Sulfated surface glycoprotein 185-like n=1 Tax=Gymnodraco acuticeps TaxID=8218 RepID=A0A6P8UTA4_GYMAC